MQDAIVIGAGIGGAAVAGLLAKKGLNVTLFERNLFPGGKTASYEHNGFVCDMGVHYSLLGEKGPLGAVAKHLSADLQFLTANPSIRLVWGNKSFDLPRNFKNPVSLLNLSKRVGLKPTKIIRKIQCMRKLIGAKTPKDVEPYYEITLRDFIYRYTDDQEFHNLIYLLCGIMLAVPPDVASAGEFIWVLSSFVTAASPAYPKGGFRQVSQSYLDAFNKYGGKVHFGEAVKRIKVENNKIVGVETEKSFYSAAVVVSNAGIRKTIELAGENNFDRAYAEKSKSLKDSFGGITIKYGLNYKPTDMPLTFYCPKNFEVEKFLGPMSKGELPKQEPPLYMPSPTVLDPGLAPDGHHILLVGTMVPNYLEDEKQIDKLIDGLDKKTMALFPDLKKHIVFKHTTDLKYAADMSGRATGDIVGIGQRFDQVGKNKPSPQMPVKGLYLVGCDAGGSGIGTEQAADSALNVSAMVLSSRR